MHGVTPIHSNPIKSEQVNGPPSHLARLFRQRYTSTSSSFYVIPSLDFPSLDSRHCANQRHLEQKVVTAPRGLGGCAAGTLSKLVLL
jgi:hypothetical protein